LSDELPAGVEVVSLPCEICGELTDWACTDCAIDSAGEDFVHVCLRTTCRDEHEKQHKCRPPG
jgi:hypothetical protein